MTCDPLLVQRQTNSFIKKVYSVFSPESCCYKFFAIKRDWILELNWASLLIATHFKITFKKSYTLFFGEAD